MIPVVTVVAFTLMGEHLSKQVDESTHLTRSLGIEGIADEIESPFENDTSDLPLGKE